MSNIKYFKYLDSQLAYDGNVHVKLNPRISMAKAALNMKKSLFGLNLRKKLVQYTIGGA